jgi:hypothetical protein
VQSLKVGRQRREGGEIKRVYDGGILFCFVDKSWLDAEGSGGRLITSSDGGREIDV